MSYTWWALIAMGAYGTTIVLLKVALRSIPPEVALVITNSILVAAGVGLVLHRGASVLTYVGANRPFLLVVLAGLTLSLSIISYYTALSRGPASVVAPIFAMNFAVAGVLGVAFLGEALTLPRVAGIVLAAGAIVLLAR